MEGEIVFHLNCFTVNNHLVEMVCILYIYSLLSSVLNLSLVITLLVPPSKLQYVI